MKKASGYRRFLEGINHYLVFFLIVAFLTTCCMTLFITLMANTMELTLTGEDLKLAAKLTFLNVIFLSLIFTAVDAFRRKLTVDRPAKRITEAAEKIMQGDFSVRIPTHQRFGMAAQFGDIAACFNKMAEELSGTETLRTDFIANVSHELKTPLAVMQNYGRMLSEPGLSEEKRIEYAEAITQASRSLADLITNILKLNKLENQQLSPSAAEYDLTEQLCDCLLGFEGIWEQKSIEIETDLEEDVTVRTDAEMMTLVWNNLFSNALKFTESGGKVTVRLYTDGEYATVCVSDTGCGISPEIGAHIFDKFYQGDTSHATQGNGLGLALVKRVVDITDSEISVESEPGRGSTFTVRIRRG